MKKIMVIIILFCSFELWAQFERFELFGNIGTALYSSERDLNFFKKQYNTLYASTLKEELGKSGIPVNYQIGAIYWFSEKFGFSLFYSYAAQNYRAEFNDKRVRNILVKSRTPFEGSLLFGKHDKLYLGVGIGFATSTLISSMEYADGVTSYNYDASLNGVYSTYGFSYNVDVTWRIYKGVKLVGGIIGMAGSEYSDKSFIKGIDKNMFYETSQFPKDLEVYNSTVYSGASYDFTSESAAKMSHIHAYISLQYSLPIFKNR